MRQLGADNWFAQYMQNDPNWSPGMTLDDLANEQQRQRQLQTAADNQRQHLTPGQQAVLPEWMANQATQRDVQMGGLDIQKQLADSQGYALRTGADTGANVGTATAGFLGGIQGGLSNMLGNVGQWMGQPNQQQQPAAGGRRPWELVAPQVQQQIQKLRFPGA